MNSPSRLKTALFAAASLTAATAAMAAADARAAPMEPVAVEHAVVAADHDADRVSSPIGAKRAGLAALATAALAGLARLVGFRRIRKAAEKTLETAGNAAAAGIAATSAAARTVARAVASPIRFIAALTLFAIIALVGVGLYDVEWAGGLVVGALTAATVLLGARRARKAFAGSRPGALR
jgi:hypothetical protein